MMYALVVINSHFDSKTGVMVHTGTGTVPVSDVLIAIQTWFKHPQFDPQAPVIWNIGEAFLDMSIEDLRQMYSLVRDAVDSKRTGGKTAWVHPSQMVSAMITIVRDEFDWGSEWETFQNVDEALAWCQNTA
ncbi:MAG: hypothetical protein ACR2PZ_17450 [Pseudomonadales bacterium]